MTATNIPKISVRGIRAALPSGTVLGRLSSGTGATEVIPLSAIAQSLVAQPAISAPLQAAGSSKSGGGPSQTGRPPASSFSWTNQNGATLVDHENGPLTLLSPANSSSNALTLATLTLPPSVPWTLTAEIDLLIGDTSGAYGIAVIDTAGKVVTNGVQPGLALAMTQFAAYNNYTSDLQKDPFSGRTHLWFRLTYTTSGLTGYISANGADFLTVATSTYLGTPVGAGLFTDSIGKTFGTQLSVYNLELVAGTGTNITWGSGGGSSSSSGEWAAGDVSAVGNGLTLASGTLSANPAPVTSVAGRTGAVILSSSDITDFASATKSTEETDLSSVLDAVCGNSVGSLLSRGPAGWHVIAPGAAGSILRANGSGAEAAWVPTGLVSTVMYLGAGSYAQPVTSGWTLVRLNTVYSDPTSICNTTSSTITITTGGIYLVSGVVNASGYTTSGATDMGVQVARAGATPVYSLCSFTGISSTGAPYFAAGGSFVLALNPGDEISLMVYTTAACNVSGVADPSATSLTLVGPIL